jgi:hypothetical protein
MALKFAVNNSLSAITTLPSSISGGALNLISTQTASGSATIDFTSGIDSTYDSYVFKFINIHPETNSVQFQVGFRDGGSLYDATKTTTVFGAYQSEAGDSTSLGYNTGIDQAQSTAYQPIVEYLGNDNDQSCSGTLTIFAPSSTTFVKHFIARTNYYSQDDLTRDYYLAGYCNTTTAIDGVSFKMSSGNIDDGIIKMYGVS